MEMAYLPFQKQQLSIIIEGIRFWILLSECRKFQIHYWKHGKLVMFYYIEFKAYSQ